MPTKRSADQLAERLRELRPVVQDTLDDGALALCRDDEPIEVTLARVKAVALDVFGPDVVCSYRPGKKT